METFIKYKNVNLDNIYLDFQNEFNNDNLLVEHRRYVQQNNLGYGEDPFHVIWREIVKNSPNNFKFLEIGVYKGQVLSLIKLLSKYYKKNGKILGVSPFDGAGDKYSKYDNINYLNIIQKLFNQFNLELNIDDDLIQGSSIEDDIKIKIKSRGTFDIIYIDGCHDYDCVVSDIKLMKEITKIGSYIVMDDASCNKNIERKDAHKGHQEVCKAISDEIESTDMFEEIICVGHNRVFKRII
jgi:hypothetical protein